MVDGEWDIAEIAVGSHDLEHKTVGVYGAGRIGQHIAQRLRAFDVTVLYYKRSRLSAVEEEVLGVRYAGLEEMQRSCDVVVIAAPLTPETEGLFDHDVLVGMKKGSHLVNISRGAIVDTDALAEAVNSGHLGGYAGDVWYPEPAPADHPWRSLANHALTPHVSGTTLEAQQRYAAGVRDTLQRFLDGRELESENVIVADGEIVGGAYAAAYAD